MLRAVNSINIFVLDAKTWCEVLDAKTWCEFHKHNRSGQEL